MAMQLQNPDPTSIFVEHDGEIKEVSRAMMVGPNILVTDTGLGEETWQVPRRTVAYLDTPVDITLKTRCPAKWALVDMETGELWGHDGQRFQRMTALQAGEVAEIARMAAQDV